MFEDKHTPTESSPATRSNTTTEAELLSRAKTAIESGEKSLHDAAEALVTAQELHRTTQAQMAKAVRKSEAWVSLLLKWHRSGYDGESPFGPTTKAGRLKHAKGRASSGASKPRGPRKKAGSAEANPTTTDNSGTSTSGDAGAATSAGAGSSTSKRPSPEEAKGNLIYAIDNWWRYLDDAGRVDVTKYFFKKTGARVS